MATSPPVVSALIVKTGPEAGKRFEIDSEVVVGRGEVDCVIDDVELSRRHLKARAVPDGVEIEDLGSLNGTWVEGKRVEGPTMIPDGGVIRLGETELVVEAAKPAATSARTVVAPVADAARTVIAPAVSPPPAADQAPAPAPEPVAASAPPPTNVPVKPRSAKKPPADAPPLPVDAVPPPDDAVPPPAGDAPPPPADLASAPPRPSRRGSAPPPAPARSRRPGTPPEAGAGTLGAFSPPGKPGRRKVATRLVLPAVLTFLTIFATAIALVVYFAAR